MADHCFISYSNIDGLEFARQLANELEGGEDKYVNVWFDKRDLKAGIDWRPQLAEAIRDCKFLLFVMTRDSVEPQSITNEEWAFALKYKKPIIPLRLHAGVDLPFGLGRRQWIDFTVEFKHGLARLRKRIGDLDSPQGQIQLLRERLADAERDLRRASSDDEARIKNEIVELKNDIQKQELIIKDPNKAEKQTKKNISSGLQIERQSKKTVAQALSTKFINPIPFIAPRYFQGRSAEIQQIVDFLKDKDQRVLTIIGRAGGGKTSLACYILKSLESGRLPEDLGDFKTGGIVYLSEIGSHKVNGSNIYSDLLQLLPPNRANKLDVLYRQPKISMGDKVRSLLEEFRSDPVLLLLDNFELFVDPETENLLDLELKETLENILRAPQHSIKVIITTRVPARDLALSEPGRQNNLHLDEGLKSPYAENVLRELDKDGKAGLKDASNELLGRARELTLGYPRALESLYAIISVDRYTNIEELLSEDLPETVVENLVGEAFSRLDLNGQKVMQALAIYDRPVVSAAIDYLLQFHIPGINSAPILNRLVSMHFARREGGRFYLHPTDREYAYARIQKGNSGKHIGRGARSRLWDQTALLMRAADYFVEARVPKLRWKKLDDLAPQLAEFDLRCLADDFEAAAQILEEIYLDYLILWGHSHLVVELHLRVNNGLKDGEIKITILNGLGIAYGNIGKLSEGVKYYMQGLSIARKFGDRGWEGALLANLGGAYRELCESHQAIKFFEEALTINQEIDSKWNEGSSVYGIGAAYADLGNYSKAIELFERALTIHRQVSNEKSEAVVLGSLGLVYADLGETQRAISFYDESLIIHRKFSYREGESILLENKGDALLDLGKIQEAIEYYIKAIQIADEISYPQTLNYARWGLAQSYLLQNDLTQARITVIAAQEYDIPQNNHNISSLEGIIALRQNDLSAAAQAFGRAIVQANGILSKTAEYYDAIDAKGLAMCGLALMEGKEYISLAKEAFKAARQVTNAAGIVKRNLRLFDELAKSETTGILMEVRSCIEYTL